jgi:methionyl-tRNA formyltransferase
LALRVVFIGTPDFAVPTLAEVARRHHVVAVYTRAPKPAGRRGLDLTPSPVEGEARRLELPVVSPPTLRTPRAAEDLQAYGADVVVVVAYGLILPRPVLEACRLGAFNLHASLLPRWRGAAPINRAIMAGDAETGVMVMKMEEGLDTGPVAMTERLAIGPDATAGEMHDRLAQIGAGLMGRALDALEHGSLSPVPQSPQGVTYAGKISKEETRIAWTRPWREVHDHIRGLSPFPGAWFALGKEGARIKVLRTTRGEGTGAPGMVLDDRLTVACAEGAVRILELQRAGRQAMMAEEFLRGSPIPAGTCLAS